MKQHLNTLFVTKEGAYLAKEGNCVVVRVDGEAQLRIPIHNIGGIVCIGPVGCSPHALALCADSGVAVSFMSQSGRLRARVMGFTSGNVLLRREQYRRADLESSALAIAANIVAAKIANSRAVLLRAARDAPQSQGVPELRRTAQRLSNALTEVQRATSRDQLRGLEGDAARFYFAAFQHMTRTDDKAFVFTKRTRRPPLDPINALLSFLYAMLTHDARSACETVGLDPAVGYLHVERPGRPSLALDLVEEFRAYLADRTALSLINRKQVQPSGFRARATGGVEMSEDTRKTVITEYQKRKQDEVTHPFLKERVTVGLLVHVQARLIARTIRGELDAYPAFFMS